MPLRGLLEDKIDAAPDVGHTSPSPAIMSTATLWRLQKLGQLLLFDPSYYWYTAVLVLLGDTLLTQLIIRFVQCQTRCFACDSQDMEMNMFSQTQRSTGRLICTISKTIFGVNEITP